MSHTQFQPEGEYPHVRAAFINAIAEEGTKAEAVAWLQKQWNETCALRAELKAHRGSGVLTEEVDFEYTNWEGRKSLRRARPISIRFGKSEWHPKPQWLMRAFDLDKGEEREFAMVDMEFEDSGLAALALSSAEGK